MAGKTRRGLQIALIVLAVVVVLPIIGFGLLALTFDANRLKPRIATAIEQATGRDVAIDGPIRLALSLRPMLEVDNVKLGNAPGFTPASMATLDRLDLTLALLPLVHRHIEIQELDLVHPVIALQIDAQGHDNWHFQKPPTPVQAEPQAPPSTAQPTTLRIQTMSIADGAISFADARTGASVSVDAVQFTSTQSDPDGAIHVDATGSERTMPIGVSGDIGRPSAGFMPIALTLKAADASLKVEGTAPRFAVSGSIPDLAALSTLAGRPLPALHNVSFQTDVAPPPGATYAGGLVLSGLRIGSPTGSVSGDATVTLGAPVAIHANLTGRNLDPAALIAVIPAPEPIVPSAAPTPTTSSAASPPAASPQPAAASRPSWLISDRPLPFARIPGIDADLTLMLVDTKVGEAVVASGTTHAQLHGGRLVLDPLSVDAPGGHVDATAMADKSGAAAITLRAPAMSIQPLLAALDQPDGVVGTMEIRADLHSAGATPHAMAASLDGSVGFALANGEIDNRLLVALLSRIAPEAGLLDLSGKAARSALRCVAVRADITRGVADLRALLLDTVPLRLSGGGTIDLGQETLALQLLPLARIGATGFSVPVTIRGGFRAPRAAVDAAAGGKGLGGIVMGALGADRLIAGAGQSDGCADQLQMARFGDPGAVPAALPAREAGKPAAPNLNNLLKQLLR